TAASLAMLTDGKAWMVGTRPAMERWAPVSDQRPRRSANRRERRRHHERVLLLHHHTRRIPSGPVAAGGCLGANSGSLVGVLIGPDMDPFVQRTEFRIPGADQWRELRAPFDLLRPALDQAGDLAGCQGILANLEQRSDLPGHQRGRERGGDEDLALLVGDELANRRRPAFFFLRRGADIRPMLEIVVSPDMDDLVQRADFAVPERGELAVLFPDRQGFA